MKHFKGLEPSGKPDDITVIVAQVLTKNKDYSIWFYVQYLYLKKFILKYSH